MPKPTQTTLLICLLALLLPVTSHSQTCQTSTIPATTPTSRFTDNHNGTVTDGETGLMWKKCSEGQTWNSITNACDGTAASYTWKAALERAQAVNNSSFAGQVDWRVPDLKALDSIVEEQCYSPAINLSVFPNTSSAVFWSSSPYAFNGNYAWGVYFNYGDDYAYKYYGNQVRLVRSGQ